MKSVRRKILLILSILPLPLAFTIAAGYAANVDKPNISQEDITSEFTQLLRDGSLPENFYRFLEENGIFTVEDFLHPENKHIKDIAIKRYKEAKTDNQLMSNGSISLR